MEMALDERSACYRYLSIHGTRRTPDNEDFCLNSLKGSGFAPVRRCQQIIRAAAVDVWDHNEIIEISEIVPKWLETCTDIGAASFAAPNSIAQELSSFPTHLPVCED
jgi:hypothetical protein